MPDGSMATAPAPVNPAVVGTALFWKMSSPAVISVVPV